MKRIFTILIVLCLAVSAMGQVTGTGVQLNLNQITVLIDSSTAKSIWYGFPGAQPGVQGFSDPYGHAEEVAGV